MYSVFTVSSSLSFTVIVSVLSPVDQLADSPFVTSVDPFRISIVSPGSVAVAVTLLLALFVLSVYDVTPGSNAGVNDSVPIASEERDVTEGPSCPS